MDGSDLAYWVILAALAGSLAWLTYRRWNRAGRDGDLWRGWSRRREDGPPEDRSRPRE